MIPSGKHGGAIGAHFVVNSAPEVKEMFGPAVPGSDPPTGGTSP